MPMQFHIDDDRGLVVGRASGALTDREVIDAMDKIVKETNGAALFKPVLFLIDERTALHNLSLKGFLHLKDAIEGWVRTYPGRNVRTAIVAPHNMHAAFAKMWQGITVAHPAIGATVEVFTTEAEAIAWLRG
jgi:hypothetical protein